MDRLDRLTQRLLDDVDQLGDRLAGPDCIGVEILGQLATGSFGSQLRERVESHLDDCLVCLDRFIEIRNDVRASTWRGLASLSPSS